MTWQNQLRLLCERNQLFLQQARNTAAAIARTGKTFTIDDVRARLRTRNIEAPHDNLWGAVMRGQPYKCVGYRPSSRPAGHGRIIRIYQLEQANETQKHP